MKSPHAWKQLPAVPYRLKLAHKSDSLHENIPLNVDNVSGFKKESK